MEFYWEGITYELRILGRDGVSQVIKYNTEEELASAIEHYGSQVQSVRKVIGGTIL